MKSSIPTKTPHIKSSEPSQAMTPLFLKCAFADLFENENLEPNAPVIDMCNQITAKHEGRILGFLYYGSSLRAMNDPEKMLDFYVLVDSYRKTHANPVRALLNHLIPPAVYYLENTNPDGTQTRCKYSIISLRAFERKTTNKALLSVIWGRFSQPCVLLFPKSDDIKNRIQAARSNALVHIATQTAPLIDGPIDAVRFWARGFFESYRTELRPESAEDRSHEIVARYEERYTTALSLLYGPPKNGKFSVPQASKMKRFQCRALWFLRRALGKPMAAIRVLNSAFTFSGGLDYVLHKLKSHSGVTIKTTPAQHKHPLLWSPVLAWKLYRRGAFK